MAYSKALVACVLAGALSAGVAVAQSSQVPPQPRITRADLPIQPRIMQVGVRVSDLEKAHNFYTKVLGLQRGTQYQPSPDVREWFYFFPGQERSATQIALHHSKSMPLERPKGGMGAPVMFNLQVRDVKAAVDQVEAAGGRVVSPMATRPASVFTMDVAFIEDPDGHLIELTHFR